MGDMLPGVLEMGTSFSLLSRGLVFLELEMLWR